MMNNTSTTIVKDKSGGRLYRIGIGKSGNANTINYGTMKVK
jgi:hypothetical protein